MISEILRNLHLDETAITAAALFSSNQNSDLQIEDAEVARLVAGAKKMDSISALYQAANNPSRGENNLSNIRKMILAMVDDIRIVLIKLAERLCVLRNAKNLPNHEQRKIAAEIMAIYAPLTHRLGIAQIKWELEDLAFQYLEPSKYREIVAALNENFPEREKYIQQTITKIETLLTQTGMKNFQVTGRTKHVYSIYRKMLRKNVGLSGILDVCAIRIFVPTITDCYSTLSHIHEIWSYLPKEFDDYITSPKPNGYKSIHTAVYGPDDRVVEIQIRTQEMHKHAELGIAAHWVYKEGKHQHVNYEAKISWLREVLDWQQEVMPDVFKIQQVFSDHIYVFTPEGDILELSQGATPLDFAYHIHSSLGHRCTGAKVNGNIVPLTYTLKNGDRIEILTAKEEHPSRDWLNINLGYLKSSRARAKVFNWFKKQDLELQPEPEELPVQKSAAIAPIAPPKITKHEQTTSDVYIYGVDNLLMHIASCCKPIPGEKIIGYVTQGQGISIHRVDCLNALYAQKMRPERFVNVAWSSKIEKKYQVDLVITAFDRQGLIRDITDVLAEADIMVAGLELAIDKKEQIAKIFMTIEISGLNSLSRILAKVGSVANVIEVARNS